MNQSEKEKKCTVSCGVTMTSFILAVVGMVALEPLVIMNFSNYLTKNNELSDLPDFFIYFVSFVSMTQICFILFFPVAMMNNRSTCSYLWCFLWIFFGIVLFGAVFGCSLYSYLQLPTDLSAVDNEKRVSSETTVCFFISLCFIQQKE